MLVPRRPPPRVEELARQTAEKMTPGDPFDLLEDRPAGSDAQRERVREYIQVGEKEGAKLHHGRADAPRGSDSGYFVRPTVFSDVEPGMRIAQEEIFAPVLSIMPYDDEDEAAEIANGTIYGLRRARVVDKDPERAKAFARRMARARLGERGDLQPARCLQRLQAVRARARAGQVRPRGFAGDQGDPGVAARARRPPKFWVITFGYIPSRAGIRPREGEVGTVFRPHPKGLKMAERLTTKSRSSSPTRESNRSSSPSRARRSRTPAPRPT